MKPVHPSNITRDMVADFTKLVSLFSKKIKKQIIRKLVEKHYIKRTKVQKR